MRGDPISTTQTYPTFQPSERALLVGIEIKGQPQPFTLDESLSELTQLSRTAGLIVVGVARQKLDAARSSTYIGKGKLEELVALKTELAVDVIVFDDELSPRQERELEEAFDTKILDRTGLILDIFAQHAQTREGALQVELAQYEYRLPRLTRMWTHLARQAGGGGGRGGSAGVGLRGPGETQLEVDRREIRRRLAHLRRDLEAIRAQREQYRRHRRKAGIPVVAIVGYTNTGKSTLLNALSDAHVIADDKLFATLDPTTRRVSLPSGKEILLTDTVGFIQKLPTQLVAAFRATLEEIREADVLLHIVDITHESMAEQIAIVEETLDNLGAGEVPVIVALNKIDKVTGYVAGEGLGQASPEEFLNIVEEMKMEYSDVVLISASNGYGLEDLAQCIENIVRRQMPKVTLTIPYSDGDVVSILHKEAVILQEEHVSEGTQITAQVPTWLMDRLEPYR